MKNILRFIAAFLLDAITTKAFLKFLAILVILWCFSYSTLGSKFIRPFFTDFSHYFEGLPAYPRGTGFYVNETDVVTNHHVVAGCEKLLVGGKNRRVADGIVIADDREHDLAVIHTATRVSSILYLDNKSSDIGDDVLHPDYTAEQGQYSFLYGKMKEIEGDNVVVSESGRGGNSGSPLLNKYGRVIGVIYAGHSRGMWLLLPTYTAAKNLPVLKTFLDQNRISYTVYHWQDTNLFKQQTYGDFIAAQIGCYKK